MSNELIKTFKKITPKLKKSHIVSILIIAILAAAISFLSLFSNEASQEKPAPAAPSVSIGCDRAIWNNTELELRASTKNIDKPLFQWLVDGKIAGSAWNITQKFKTGGHKVIVNVSFGNQMLQANQSIIVIDSIEGVSLLNSLASKNQWGFQTVYRGRTIGVKGVKISIDSSLPEEVNTCGRFNTKALFAGEYAWRAEYQGKIIATGTFNLKEASEIKVTKIEVAPRYRAGDTVNGKIVLKNTGSTTIKEFAIRTTIVNHKYEWMGDAAKKEYFNQYNSNIKPGELYEIPIQVTIPEKVSGIRPSGSYTITVNLILSNKIMDTKAVNTQVE